MTLPSLFDLPNAVIEDANVVVLPLPFEGTVSYGKGTSDGPTAILQASNQVELWDEEVNFDLESLAFHAAAPILPHMGEAPEHYLSRVEKGVRDLLPKKVPDIFIGIGGEHSLTPPLVRAAVGRDDLAGVTVVQFDAHADLRDTFEDSPHSHACAMRRVVELGARVIAVGIRSAEREEFEFATGCDAVETFAAQALAEDDAVEVQLIERLESLTGDVYLTFDIDALEVHLCPGTGTPQPGGLDWWQALRYLRALLIRNQNAKLIGTDIVETAPMPGTVVNELVAARLLAKMVCYRFAGSTH